MKKFFKRIIPDHAIVPLIIVVVANCFAYWVGGAVGRASNSLNTSLNMSLPLDLKLPVMSWTVLIYTGAFPFWAANYILACRKSKQSADIFMISEVMGKMICFLFFIFLPCTLYRPMLEGTGFFDQYLNLVYRLDAPTNLFPSLHCYASWMCYLGIKNDESIPKWYKVFSAIFAIMICISTVTTKQHVIADTFSGVLLAQITYQITVYFKLYQYLEKEKVVK